MIKKLLVLLVFLMIFSCEAIRELEPGPIFPTDDRDSKSGVHSTAFGKEKVVKDILNRPINNNIYYEGIRVLIPEGTKLNDKKNKSVSNIVDIKTKIGLSIYVTSISIFDSVKTDNLMNHCPVRYYCKVVNRKLYAIVNNYGNDNEDKIYEKIVKVNGFVRGTYK